MFDHVSANRRSRQGCSRHPRAGPSILEVVCPGGVSAAGMQAYTNRRQDWRVGNAHRPPPYQDVFGTTAAGGATNRHQHARRALQQEERWCCGHRMVFDVLLGNEACVGRESRPPLGHPPSGALHSRCARRIPPQSRERPKDQRGGPRLLRPFVLRSHTSSVPCTHPCVSGQCVLSCARPFAKLGPRGRGPGPQRADGYDANRRRGCRTGSQPPRNSASMSTARGPPAGEGPTDQAPVFWDNSHWRTPFSWAASDRAERTAAEDRLALVCGQREPQALVNGRGWP